MPGRRRSVSRVPGAPPRTTPDATVPGGGSTTVHPVSPTGSVQWPTRMPGTRVIIGGWVSTSRVNVAARDPGAHSADDLVADGSGVARELGGRDLLAALRAEQDHLVPATDV